MFVAPALAQETAVDAVSEVHTEVGVPGEAHQKDVFPPFDSTHFSSQILWLAITFGLFYIFLKRVLLPRVGNTMDDRRERIASDLDEAARLKQEADASVAAYEQELADARRASASIAQDARNRAKADADVERRNVESALEANLKEAEQRIAQIKTSALADVDAVAEAAAEAIVSELVGGKVDKTAVAAAVKAVQ